MIKVFASVLLIPLIPSYTHAEFRGKADILTAILKYMVLLRMKGISFEEEPPKKKGKKKGKKSSKETSKESQDSNKSLTKSQESVKSSKSSKSQQSSKSGKSSKSQCSTTSQTSKKKALLNKLCCVKKKKTLTCEDLDICEVTSKETVE